MTNVSHPIQRNTHPQAEVGERLLHAAMAAAPLDTNRNTFRGVEKEPETGATVPSTPLLREVGTGR